MVGKKKSYEEGDEGSCVEVGGLFGFWVRTRKKKKKWGGGPEVMCKACLT